MFTVLTYVLALSGNLPSSFLNSLLSLGNQLALRLPLLLADKVRYKLKGDFSDMTAFKRYASKQAMSMFTIINIMTH